MINPINIIAGAIRAADGNHTLGAGQLAEVATDALTDDRIVAECARALIDRGWTGSELDATAMARLVLRSVGGA